MNLTKLLKKAISSSFVKLCLERFEVVCGTSVVVVVNSSVVVLRVVGRGVVFRVVFA